MVNCVVDGRFCRLIKLYSFIRIGEDPDCIVTLIYHMTSSVQQMERIDVPNQYCFMSNWHYLSKVVVFLNIVLGNLRKRVVESTMEATENGSLGFYDE